MHGESPHLTRNRVVALLALLLGWGLSIHPALAQEEAAPGTEVDSAACPADTPRAIWRLGGRLGAFDMVGSKDSYDAVYGKPMPQLGLEVEVELARRWLLSLAWDHGEVDGEQVLPTNPPRGTGVGTTLTYQPLALTAAVILNPASSWGVYVGGGAIWLDWEEKGAVRGASDTATGGHAVLGVRRRNVRRWDLGGELRYSTLPGAAGGAGIAAFFGEDDLGGLSLHFVALYRLGGP